MNRISEWRRKRGFSAEALAQMVGTTQPTIHRLDSDKTKLTVDWMSKLAVALDISPLDLLATASLAELGNDVEEAPDLAPKALRAALSSRNLKAYKILSDSVERLSLTKGAPVFVDGSESAVEAIKTGDIVLANAFERIRHGPSFKIFRQYIAPGLLVTNRAARNAVISMDDKEFSIEIIGVASIGDNEDS